MFITS